MEKLFYTEKEKAILINFFIDEKNNSKKDFKEYLECYVNKHGNKVHDKFKNRRIDGVWSELGNYEIDKVEYFWGNETDDNLVTYLYAQRKFIPSSTKIKNLDKLQINWNHLNNKGENILFYTRMYHLEVTNGLIEKHNLATDLVNINGDVFFTHIFDDYRSTSRDLHETRVEEGRLESTMNLVGKYNELLEFMSIDKIEYMQNKFHECVDTIEKKLYECAARENKGVSYSYEEDKLNESLPYKEHRIYMDKIFNYHLINKKLVINENKEKSKKLKI